MFQSSETESTGFLSNRILMFPVMYNFWTSVLIYDIYEILRCAIVDRIRTHDVYQCANKVKTGFVFTVYELKRYQIKNTGRISLSLSPSLTRFIRKIKKQTMTK